MYVRNVWADVRLLLSALLLPALVACGGEKASTPSAAPVRVRTMAAGMTVAAEGCRYTGTVEEESGTFVSFATAGTVSRLDIQVGDRVRKGQVIGSLDDTALRSAWKE